MSTLQKESQFFHDIIGAIRKTIALQTRDITITEQKQFGDYSTHVDVMVEKLIIEEIKERFPNDTILAEETHGESVITNKRIWIIDPICGTRNLARGIKNFCTNLALAENKKVIASCVIDHSSDEYYWSIGGGEVYVNTTLLQPRTIDLGVVIDIDFGALLTLDAVQKEKHGRCTQSLLTQTNYSLVSLNSSLGFVYTAVGKLDGFLTFYNHPWDICAASFLIQQSGGVITTLSGKEWTITTPGAIAARNKEIHQKLVDIYLNN